MAAILQWHPMALRSTVYKAELAISDIDRGRYASHALTIALHPSETLERLMLRLLAFSLLAEDGLQFGPGLSSEGEPDLVLADDTGRLRLWVEVGLPDEKWVRKACGRADRVVILAYGGHKAEVWWRQQQGALARHRNLSVCVIDPHASEALAKLGERSMRVDCTVQDAQVWMGIGERSVTIEPVWWAGSIESARGG